VAVKTQYAKNGDVHVAYQVLGDGPIDLLLVPGFVSHLDLAWTDPYCTAFLRRLASFSRLILHDKRGTGLSDPVVGIPPLEARMEDVHCVLDAVGSSQAALFGISEGGPMSLLFAATYPERVRSLVVYGTFAHGAANDEHEGAAIAEHLEKVLDGVRNHWGDGSTLALFAPSVNGPGVRDQAALFERAAASPRLAAAVMDAVFEIDVTDILPAVRVPTLVLHRTGDPIPISGGRYVADHVPGARFIELTGSDHIPWVGDTQRVCDEIERFVTGSLHGHRPDRMLTTVLFTDIVGSTELASRLGDARWRDRLTAHDSLVRSGIRDHGGREVKRTGDGFLATFDGPARAIRSGCAIRDALHEQLEIEIRAGIHTGECEVVDEDDLGGLAVHIGARIADTAAPGEVLVSSTVRDLVVGSEIAFADRGVHELKGAPGRWRLLAVTDSASTSMVGQRTDPDPRGRQERVLLAAARHAPWLIRRLSRRTMGTPTST
jgi:class 3 adenylate cyclase